MAEIVLGIGTSHGPMLATPWEKWGERVAFDKSTTHDFRGKRYKFDELVAFRKNERLEKEIGPSKWEERHRACQDALGRLSEAFSKASPDVALIVGNDQRELFSEHNTPAFSVFYGDKIENRPRTEEQIAKLPPGIAIAERGHAPPADAIYPGCPDLGLHIIESLMDDGFDISTMKQLPQGTGYVNGVPHAYGFIYRQIMRDDPPPSVPIVLNTFYPPNQPTSGRCLAFGKALGRAVKSWKTEARVAVIASGGLSHFVIDEKLDRKVLAAFEAGDVGKMSPIPENYYQSGTSEIKNWLPVAALMADFSLKMELIDYIPCYRSTAGTGNAMGFAIWTP
ncbi:MAG: hypothetical protein VW226_00045 [Rhodospirillaceae bacterium]